MASAAAVPDSVLSLAERKAALEAAHKTPSTSILDHMKKNETAARSPTTLAQAAMDGDVAKVAQHIEAGVDVNGEVDFGGTAILHASFKGRVEIVKALLGAGARLDAVTKGSRTAVHLAAEKDHAEVLALLLASEGARAVVNLRDRDGRTALMIAAQSNAAGACRELLAGGADMEVSDEGGDTALMLAARLGSVEAMEVIARAGASFYKTDDGAGGRAFDAARQCTHPSAAVRERVYDLLLDIDLDRDEA